MKVLKTILVVLIVLGALATIVINGYNIYLLKSKSKTQSTATTAPPTAPASPSFVWGATIRPFALNSGKPATSIDQQFKYVTELFPKGACVRANVETSEKVNDAIIAAKKKYNTTLYIVLEEKMNFDDQQDYKKMAQDFAEKIVGRYKDQVEYYQLMNEVSGVVYSKDDEKGDKLDAGYGLKMNKNRYENVLTYTKAMSNTIRKIDPRAKIILSGHWVLIKPVLQLIKDGVDVDIVGWNWGSGLSNNPGVIEIGDYGVLNIPVEVHKIRKKFWIVEANRDDGSVGGKEQDQASTIASLATVAKSNKYITGYFHFVLTDTRDEGPAGQLGLVTITQKGDAWVFGAKKPAFSALQKAAAN